jgi:phage tail-like protein
MMVHPGTARPCLENPDPPRLDPRGDLTFPEGHRPVAMAGNPQGQAGFLLWPENDGAEAVLVLLDEYGFSRPVQLAHAIAPFALGWVGNERWAVLFQGVDEAAVYDVPSQNPPPRAHIVGDRYPLTRGPYPAWSNKPFCSGLNEPVHYQSSLDGTHMRTRPLHRLSMPALANSAEVDVIEPIDSGGPGTVWHRVYLEASLPPGTGIRLFLAAADDPSTLNDMPEMEHRFGTIPSGSTAGEAAAPLGTWVSDASEIPFHTGMLGCPREKDVAGLFTVLVQRPGRRVRTLQGRYLRVRLEIIGNGTTTPEIAAIRIYAPRFSYLDRYLPELYRETEFSTRAEKMETATGADFLQRFLCLFEGMLTPIEDKVAAAHVVTDPYSAPTEALDWLANWLGLTLLPGLPEPRRRRLLAEASRLYRRHGTLPGLSLALDIATGDRVACGDIVILEDYRLRRTFATIIGADLAEEEDPLMNGMVASGNSYVGDTLFLGEEETQEFLALFLSETAKTEQARKSITELYDRLAHRITLLVHHETPPEELRLIHRVVELETPAHVQARILSVSTPLRIGLSALVGVDTYPRRRPRRRPVRSDVSHLGRRDVIQGLGSLDPRLGAGPASAVQPGVRRPIAGASDVVAEYGRSFTLDGGGSKAFGGREIAFYHWSMKNRGE